jgi:DNA polymerase-1
LVYNSNPDSDNCYNYFMTNRLVLIDGHAILHRAFHAFPPTLTTRKGELVNAVYGFTRMLLSVIGDLQPECIAVAFDLPKPTFRHKEYLGYQSQRPKMDEELAGQIERVRQVVEAMGIPSFTAEGFEADDVMATLAKQAIKDPKIRRSEDPKGRKKEKKNIEIDEVVIVTGDRDIMQLVTDRVKVYAPQRSFTEAKLYGPEEVKDYLGVKPKEIVDYKALVGDPSDNYPGVAGVGPKTAVGLLTRYGTLEGIYAHLNKIENEMLRVKLRSGKESALLSQKLARIVTTAPVKLDLKKCLVKDYDPAAVREVFEELEFKSLIGKLPGVEHRAKGEEEKEEGEQMRLL